MAVSKVILNNETLMDVTQDSVTASTLLEGETATGSDGVRITGTATTGGGASLLVTVTESGGAYTLDKTGREIKAVVDMGGSVVFYRPYANTYEYPTSLQLRVDSVFITTPTNPRTAPFTASSLDDYPQHISDN